MKKDNVRFGIYFLLGWNVLLWLCIHLRYLFFDPGIYQSLLGDTYQFWFSAGTVLLWSAIWFVIGYYVRKEYAVKRQQFRECYSHLEDDIVDRYYRYTYFAKYAGFLYKIAWVSIPAYILYRREFFDGDFLVVVLLALLGALFFYVHRRAGKKSRL